MRFEQDEIIKDGRSGIRPEDGENRKRGEVESEERGMRECSNEIPRPKEQELSGRGEALLKQRRMALPAAASSGMERREKDEE